jgi:hypothetical protein
MRKIRSILISAVTAAFIFAWGVGNPLWGMGKNVEVPLITPDELRPMIGNPDVVIIDVRVGDEWTKSKEKIQGAAREAPEKVNQWAVKYPKEKTIVFY